MENAINNIVNRSTESPATEVIPKARRRRFSVAYKLRILREANGCAGSSAVGTLLRKRVMRTLRIGMGFAVLVWMLSPYATSAQQNQTCSLQSDYEILKKLYNSTGGGVAWDKQKTWNMNLSPSQVNRNAIGDMIEILDDRHRNRSTIATSQMPVKHWHQAMENPTLADAILDRLVHNAHHIELQGESMRKRLAQMEPETPDRTR